MKKTLIAASMLLTLTALSQVPSYVSTNGLVGFWPFKGNANDQSINSNNGIVSGAVLTADRFGTPTSAYNFNGISDNIMVPDNITLSGYTDMSISVWINITSFNGIQDIVAKWYQLLSCGNNSDTYVAALNYSQIQLATNANNMTAFINPPALNNNDLNTWKHLVFISSATQGQFIYLNGVLVATDNTASPVCATTNALYFGAGFDSNTNANALHRFFGGKIDDIGIWNRAITICEIKQLYTATVSAVSAASSAALSCPGLPVTLTASGANTYTWSNGSNGASVVVTPNSTTAYTVTGTNTITGCTSTFTLLQTVSECTGIKEFTLKNDVTLYPNPTKGPILLTATSEHYTIEVFNALGALIYKGKSENYKTTIDLSEQTNGLYFVKLITGNGIVIKKINKE